MFGLGAGLVLLALSGPLAGEEPPELPPLYRVEVIVFTHEQSRSDGFLTEDLRSFNGLIDPLEMAEAERRAIRAAEAFARMYPAQSPLPSDRRESETLPKPFLAIDELSHPMSQALRRLEDSAAYRPVAWRVWYQPAERGMRTPPIRLHDEAIVLEVWPKDEVLQAHRRIIGAGVEEVPEAADGEKPETRPENYYRLDGSVRLHQRQFLHFDLDLQWREPASRPGPGGYAPEAHGEKPRSWSIHRLRDSRVVRTRRLEYFDSAWLGVLVHLERFEQPVIETEGETVEQALD